MEGALAGIRVIDMTTVVMGPYATQILGDFGADVIKIESPSGDVLRGIGPFRNPGMGHCFLHLNRNKRSVVLDLKQPEGLAALMKLVETADVLLYNVRPQAMARLGVTYDRLSKINLRLIVAGAFGFGQDGPYAAKPAYDDLVQGILGLPSLVAEAGNDGPRFVPANFMDHGVALHAVNAVIAALYVRERTGRGQEIHVPMFESMVPFILGEHMAGRTFEPQHGPTGYTRLLAKQRRPFATLDGHVCVMFYSDRHWRTFCELMGEPERFDQDARIRNMSARAEHMGELNDLVADMLKTRTTAEWLQVLEKADIPVVRLHTLDSLIDDPHLTAIGYFSMKEHPSEGMIRVMEPAGMWSDTPPSIRRLPPRLGEHSVEVLLEAGLGREEIDALIQKKVTL